MTRRMLLVLPMMLLAGGLAGAQDRAWLRSWEEAQRQRPAELTWQGRIAPAGEPGSPMVIHGHVFESDGRTPAAGAIVFAYQTDQDGHYDRPGTGPHSWRLRGWARAGTEGRFELTTIRPGAYPSRTEPAHVHFTIETPTGQRYWGQDLRPDQAAVRRLEGADHVVHALRIESKNRF